jgi:hypothetical protein
MSVPSVRSRLVKVNAEELSTRRASRMLIFPDSAVS